MTRDYPRISVGDYEAPPHTFTDSVDRAIELHCYGESSFDDDYEALVEMYLDFDPADRAQGIPPIEEHRIKSWLDTVLEGINVLAWHQDRVVGHAILVPDDDRWELAIFVDQDYQRSGIGRHLIEALLAEALDRGAERIWLTVERWNHPAVNLYRDVGFMELKGDSLEKEMGMTVVE